MIKAFSSSILFLFITFNLQAQNWGGGVDQDILHFGFTFQYIRPELKVFKRENWRSPVYDTQNSGEQLKPGAASISSPKTTGFGLGFVSDLKLSEHVNLRFTPVLAFTERALDFRYPEPYTKENVISRTPATLIDLPLGFKIKSDRQTNYRAYLLAGLKYSYDIKKKDNKAQLNAKERVVLNQKSYLSYEAGIGLDLYFEFFKLSPELKFSQSFGDILKRDPANIVNPYSQPLDKLMLRSIQFSLFFE